MRSRRKRNAGTMQIFPAFAITIVMALTAYVIYYNGSLLEKAGENAAIISAVINMPDSGIDILRDRFKSEIYGDEKLPESKPQDNVQQWPPPQVAEKVQDKAAPEPARQSVAEPGRNTPVIMPKIPEKYAAPLISEDFSGGDNANLAKFGSGYIRNETKYEKEDIEEILTEPFPIRFMATDEPQVLIVHTHATESYEKYDRDIYDTRNTWRSTDNNNNMVSVGNVMREVLEQNGIGVLHDTTQHDHPSYNGSYERSAQTIKDYLEEYPSIKVVLDLHRDAMQRDDAIVKAVTTIDGIKAAQIMIIAACDDGSMNIPEWRENLRFAAAFQDYMEQSYPGLTKPVYFCYRKYNMDLTTGSLLLEFGSNGNTLEEAMYSARMAAEALSRLIQEATL